MRAVAGSGAIALLACLVAPDSIASLVASAAVGVTLLGALVFRAVRGTNRGGWALLAAGVATIGVANQMWLLGIVPHPTLDGSAGSWADGVSLSGYLLVAAGFVVFARAVPRGGGGRRAGLDVAVGAVAAVMALWLVVVQPTLDAGRGWSDLVPMLHPVADLLVTSTAVALGVGRRPWSLAYRALIGALGVLLIADVYHLTVYFHSLTLNPLMDQVGWVLAGTMVIITAVSVPPGGTPIPPAPRQPLDEEARLLPLVGVVVLGGLVTVAVRRTAGRDADALVLTLGSTMLFVLVTARLAGLLGRLRRLLGEQRANLAHEAALRRAAEQFVSAADDTEILAITNASTRELLGPDFLDAYPVIVTSSGAVQLLDGHGLHDLDLTEHDLRLLGTYITGHQADGAEQAADRARVALHARHDAWLTALLVAEWGSRKTFGVVATVVPPPRSVWPALFTLATQTALAVEGAVQARRQARARTEGRYRQLVENAWDMVVVTDALGLVQHATPAVRRMLGYDPQQLIGQPWQLLVDEVMPGTGPATGGGEPAEAGVQRSELRLRHADGSIRIVEAVISRFDDGATAGNGAGVGPAGTGGTGGSGGSGGSVITCHDISDRRELEQRLTHQAFHDALTGLPNRALFADRVEHALARTARYGGTAVLFVDLDDFKAVNDTLGHGAGDRLLVIVSHRLRACLRRGDTPARLGGDEFAVLLEDVVEESEATVIAARIVSELTRPVQLGEDEVVVTASVGVALSAPEHQRTEDLLRDADLALYDAKQSGKSRFAVFAPAMHEDALHRLGMVTAMRHGLARREFVVRYQPIVDLTTGAVVGAEALVRWQHPTRGLLEPAEFIPLAEESGMIVPLGGFVLETAIAQAAAWRRGLPTDSDFGVSINLSARQLAQPGLPEQVAALCQRSGLPASACWLEITETVLLQDVGAVAERLAALRAMGARVLIDDFGTGYSSLSYLARLPVDGLKVAREFVAEVPGPAQSVGLVRTIHDLADTLGLSTVCEGVETRAQVDVLSGLGYQVAQGFLFAHPIEAAALTELLASGRRLGQDAGHPLA